MARLAVLPLIALLASPAAAQTPAADGEAERILAALTDPAGLAAPGCAVGIFRDGKIATQVSTAAADIEARRAIDADTQFYAASVSKQFTAIAIMQLVVAGKLNLSDDIRKYLPEMPRYQRPVTVRMLLNHTGGIRDSLALMFLNGYSDISVPTREEALRVTMAQKATKFEPGTRYDYSNGGYLLLSEIVQRVSGERFATYVDEHVLKPARMTRSFVLDGKRTTDPNFARGYTREDGKLELADNYPLFGGSGGVVTTINDLAKWDHDIDTGHKVWTAEILKLMIEPGVFNNGVKVARTGRGTYYASGLMVGPSWFGHSGGASGFRTYYARNQGQRLGVALLCNRGEIDPGEVSDKIVAAIGGGLPPITQPAVVADALDGRYRSDDLDATYVLHMGADDTLGVTVLGPDGETRRAVSGLKRTPTGSFRIGGFEIVPDDDLLGFMLVTGRVSLPFVRVS